MPANILERPQRCRGNDSEIDQSPFQINDNVAPILRKARKNPNESH